MKYRLLTPQEQEIFDEDFKYFLITHGVKNEEWLEMNQSDPKKATELVALFSDAVLDIVYKKVKFIEFRSKSSCLVFYCKEEEMELISINSKSDQLDLSTPESIHHALSNHAEHLTVFKSNKKYNVVRESEIHQMLEQGCFNSSQDFWDALTLLIPSK
ncbi:MAG: hypothetical protein KJ941_11215 [Bacteroidetes bacterium]|nr:hypothetical protein [Bacteroidota bacterium]